MNISPPCTAMPSCKEGLHVTAKSLRGGKNKESGYKCAKGSFGVIHSSSTWVTRSKFVEEKS